MLAAIALLFAQHGLAVAVPCKPTLASTTTFLSEGPSSPTEAAMHLPASAQLRATVLFVDFSDAPGGRAALTQVSAALRQGAHWFRVSSYRKAGFAITPILQWLRMPQPSASYGFPHVSYAQHRACIADALAAADASVDFSQTDVVYVVAALAAGFSGSQAFHGNPGTFVLDGRDVSRVATFGSDVYSYGRTVMVHETGHLLGLPDLYPFTGVAQRFVGSWDLMGDIFAATDFNAWHRLKLNWLSPGQFRCAKTAGVTRAVLTPLERAAGVKALFLRTGPYTAIVVENRQALANDASICEAGLLVYSS